jgi:hypothetical protein
MQSSLAVAGMRDPAKTFDTSGKSPAIFHHRAICKTQTNLAPASERLEHESGCKSVGRIGAEGVIRRYVWQDGGLWLRLQRARQATNLIRVTRLSAPSQLQNSRDGAKDRLQQHLRFTMDPEIAKVALWRPVGPKELDLIRQTGMRAFPPRLPEQPIFYPVLSEAYATKIARDWNVPASGKGYVTRFFVPETLLDRYQVREAGGKDHLEYWIPAEDLEAFNDAIIGPIEIVAEFG